MSLIVKPPRHAMLMFVFDFPADPRTDDEIVADLRKQCTSSADLCGALKAVQTVVNPGPLPSIKAT